MDMWSALQGGNMSSMCELLLPSILTAHKKDANDEARLVTTLETTLMNSFTPNKKQLDLSNTILL